MVKVANQDDSDSPSGMEALRKIVLKRLSAANITQWTSAFDSLDTWNYLCRMSGGHLRNLLILIRSACTIAGVLPLTHRVIEQAVRGISNDFERALNHPDFFKTLRDIDRTKALPGSKDDQMLLYNLSVLEYLNGEVWYVVNPAVKALEKFKSPRRAAKPRSR